MNTIKTLWFTLALSAILLLPAYAADNNDPQINITDIKQTVVQMSVKVPREDAIQALMSRAAEINLKFVSRQQVSKELQARGLKTPYLDIFQFCNPEDARKMIMHDPIYAAYMPCRIAMVEDKQGQLWLMMLNLDMLINSQMLPPELTEIAIRVNQAMLDVMVAGATGEF
ncbi:DUF302 domain-containing protein [Candidatus Endoriftia persephonae]|jgi:uncharacterized protein (DUF302 family)|uniref:DUF302 domain-containing protein n=4 Tax=Gammaproteobacteria TaxID=1236 RepID=G2FIH5_9GAMM|nr:DUF302 domain-containing protein [Candidatus Endoriftia persephone]EGV51011.1 hypothetical protein Rifp1Sym_bz00170 [endosymbiont of Riftia pachyptila (vent Ph05)]EGW53365.1 hypothetical protein TevJSym_bd00010 [endosymbiont of Tevnia jerichonana (vent Tica)]KRT54324.1 hypothetical protein Ga0074115_10485 [endosymbiont of Ridgeia piscesae]KRT58506.1 Uncharacterized conserved protein, DUF302 family [endosymbiont of Ridgeia piscesae]USF87135.1 DUF302 domain-containing protein [Candidatus Endo